MANVGETVGFNIKGLSVKDIKRGYVAGPVEYSPPKACVSFVGRVMITDHPGIIMAGYTPVIDVHTAHVACRFNRLLSRIDVLTL